MKSMMLLACQWPEITQEQLDGRNDSKLLVLFYKWLMAEKSISGYSGFVLLADFKFLPTMFF